MDVVKQKSEHHLESFFKPRLVVELLNAEVVVSQDEVLELLKTAVF